MTYKPSWEMLCQRLQKCSLSRRSPLLVRALSPDTCGQNRSARISLASGGEPRPYAAYSAPRRDVLRFPKENLPHRAPVRTSGRMLASRSHYARLLAHHPGIWTPSGSWCVRTRSQGVQRSSRTHKHASKASGRQLASSCATPVTSDGLITERPFFACLRRNQAWPSNPYSEPRKGK